MLEITNTKKTTHYYLDDLSKEKISKYRKDNNLRIKDLANELQISYSYMKSILGGTCAISENVIIRLKELGVEL